MSSKHTPGPWAVAEVAPEFYGHGKYWVAYVDLGTWPDLTATVAPCIGLEGQPINREVVEANAHLIAAAPDLLAALEDLLPWLEDCRMADGARAAITKARGQ
jgi:hypothetical protein